METSNGENEIKIPEIKTIFKKRFLFNKMLYKIKLKPIDPSSNYNTITNFNIQNIDNKNNNLRTQKTYNELDKNIFKDHAKTLSLNNKSNICNYKNTDLNKDLKRYTNNSLTFKIFKELNNPYHSYAVNKAKKSILLRIKNDKNKENIKEKKVIPLNSIKILLNHNLKNLTSINLSRNNFFIKTQNKTFVNKNNKASIFFNNIGPVKALSTLDDNDKKDLELRDEVDFKIYENEKLKKSIRNSLLNDINHDETNYKLYLNYLKPLTNKINFFEDIYIIPHIKNNLALSRPFDNLVILYKKLKNKNLLERHVALSMNRICIINKLLKIEREMEMQKLIEESEYKSKRRLSNNINNINIELNKYEKEFKNFELNDFFDKCYNNTFICFADKKLKHAVFSNNLRKKSQKFWFQEYNDLFDFKI